MLMTVHLEMTGSRDIGDFRETDVSRRRAWGRWLPSSHRRPSDVLAFDYTVIRVYYDVINDEGEIVTQFQAVPRYFEQYDSALFTLMSSPYPA